MIEIEFISKEDEISLGLADKHLEKLYENIKENTYLDGKIIFSTPSGSEEIFYDNLDLWLPGLAYSIPVKLVSDGQVELHTDGYGVIELTRLNNVVTMKGNYMQNMEFPEEDFFYSCFECVKIYIHALNLIAEKYGSPKVKAAYMLNQSREAYDILSSQGINTGNFPKLG